MLRILVFLTGCLAWSACSPRAADLAGVDSERWKDDRNGCKNERRSMEAAIRNECGRLKGLSEMEIIATLGKPDENELYRRNQKFYYYYISRAPHCEAADSAVVRLAVRFNAMGYAQQVVVEP